MALGSVHLIASIGARLHTFRADVLLVAGALSAALLASKLSARTSVPSAALFLVAAAVASDLLLVARGPIATVERIATSR